MNSNVCGHDMNVNGWMYMDGCEWMKSIYDCWWPFIHSQIGIYPCWIHVNSSKNVHDECHWFIFKQHLSNLNNFTTQTKTMP